MRERKIKPERVRGLFELALTDSTVSEPCEYQIGEKLNDRYELENFLGQGGMGVVFLAFDRLRQQHLALKVLKVGKDRQPERLQRFLREIKILSRLAHPNIVQIFDVGESFYRDIPIPVPFYTMEYIPGKTLQEFLQKQHSLRWVVDVIGQLSSALIYAHDQNIVHRDIKPPNILLSVDSATAKLLDFGIAKIFDEDDTFCTTHSKNLLGTPHYMAQEQFRTPGKADARSDIYSLAAVMYQLLCGIPPLALDKNWHYREEKDIAAIERAFSDPVVVDFSPYLHLDEALQSICAKALEYDREQRYQSVCEFADDLRQYWQKQQNGQYHFLLSAKSEAVSIGGKASLVRRSSGEIVIAPATDAELVAEIVPILGDCQLYCKQPLSVNGALLEANRHCKLWPGDCLVVGDELFCYKRAKNSIFYEK